MISQKIISNEGQSLQYLCAAVFEELVEVFLFCSPESDREVFMQKIYHPTRIDNLGGDVVAKLLKECNGGRLNLVHLILISCAYCIQANDVESKPAWRWSYLMDAQLYLGMAKAGVTSDPQVAHLRAAVVKDSLASNARNIGSVSANPWRRAKDEAMRLIRELGHAGGRWATPTEAARVIAQEIELFLTTLEPRKKFQGIRQRDVKIAIWLSEMPEAPQLFVSMQK